MGDEMSAMTMTSSPVAALPSFSSLSHCPWTDDEWKAWEKARMERRGEEIERAPMSMLRWANVTEALTLFPAPTSVELTPTC